MAGSTGEVSSSVPPGFRFHPTEEELLYYYLRKKVSYQPIDLNVISEVDLNKLEPWDLKDKCRIGSGPQNDWYFFSHKDKKYPSGTRTNRATAAGFWKATGRDKAIHHSTNSNRIGMRKTLVFYMGRAPRGHKTDWIMHEYRLMDDQDYASHHELQEDGWVICRVFRKKNQTRGFQFHLDSDQEQHFIKIMPSKSTTANGDSDSYTTLQPKQYSTCDHEARYNHNSTSLIIHHLPQLHSRTESTVPIPLILSSSHELLPIPLMSTTMDPQSCPHSMIKFPASIQQEEKYCSTGDWSFLEKLLPIGYAT